MSGWGISTQLHPKSTNFTHYRDPGAKSFIGTDSVCCTSPNSCCSSKLSKNVVRSSFHRVPYVESVTKSTPLNICMHHHKRDVGNLPVYIHTTAKLMMWTVIAKSHANLDLPTTIVTKSTQRSESKSHNEKRVIPMALSGSINSHEKIQSTLKS